MTNVEPMEDRIVVRPIEPEEVSKGGIIIPATSKDKPQLGEVLAAGEGVRREGAFVAVTLQPGDKILFGKYSGMEVTLNGDKVLILRASDVLARVHDD